MKLESKRDYLKDIRKEYFGYSKKKKGEMLEKMVKELEWSREHIIRQLSFKNNLEKPIKRQRKKYYTDDLKFPLVKIWEIFNFPCSVALKEIVNRELPRLRKQKIISVSKDQFKKLIKMSARTMENMLKKEKNKIKKDKTNTRSNPFLMKSIKTKMSFDYDRNKAGYIQIDGVEHTGETASGEYAVTISSVDVGSYWFEAEAIMGKGQERTLKAINRLRSKMPFKWQEIHPDNGSNFINYHLYDYAKSTNLDFTRSREYKKNDNCFVEQSNGSVIRQFVGYLRYDTIEEINALNKIYEIVSLYRNFFHPVIRLKSKERIKGHIMRKYETPKTPYQWLIESDEITEEEKKKLTEIYDKLNPLELKTSIDKAIYNLLKLNKEKRMNKKLKTKKPVSMTSYFAQQPNFQ